MAIRTSFPAIDRTVGLVLDRALSPEERGKRAAAAARRILAQVQEAHRAALGRVPDVETFVDNRHGAPLESVNTNGGHILFKFNVFEQVLIYIDRMLVEHSPVKTGAYQRSHTLYADLKEIDINGPIPPAEEYVFISSLPYSRKVERGESPQAPDGVYEATAVLAAYRFRRFANIRFTWQAPTLNYMRGGSNREQRQMLREGPWSQLQAAGRQEQQTRYPAIKITRF